jgi:2,3-bisphosphoglycerate-independent phosphoglycerate mutase
MPDVRSGSIGRSTSHDADRSEEAMAMDRKRSSMDAALVVLDGWGLGTHGRRNAVEAARTPVFDEIEIAGADGTLIARGRRVGLPEGQMGNSEVGHLTIGAGRIVKQPYTRIQDAIADGSFAENDALTGAIEHVERTGGRLHLMGLVSDGGVHAALEHLDALIELAGEYDVEAVTHAFMDGRDTPPDAGADYLRDLEPVLDEHGTGDVATVSGRYYAMDRDENWERTNRAYDAIVNREAEYESASGIAAVEESYNREVTDEFVEPTLVRGTPPLEDGDAVIFFNFRPDRARQLVRMLTDTEPVWAFDTDPPDIELVTMTEYDERFDFPVAFPPHEPEDTLGSVLAEHGLVQFRIAESEKYPHVTYFLNGGREVAFDGEHRGIVDSPDVPTYDEQPEMSAPEVTDVAIDYIEREDPDVLVLNYANPDMVGHTGDYEAAITAVETVDEQLGRLLSVLDTADASILVTADHGNADDMGTAADPHTAHTTNPVPIVYLAAGTAGSADRTGNKRVRAGGGLADITPTLLDLLELEQPDSMTGTSLLEAGQE